MNMSSLTGLDFIGILSATNILFLRERGSKIVAFTALRIETSVSKNPAFSTKSVEHNDFSVKVLNSKRTFDPGVRKSIFMRRGSAHSFEPHKTCVESKSREGRHNCSHEAVPTNSAPSGAEYEMGAIVVVTWITAVISGV